MLDYRIKKGQTVQMTREMDTEEEFLKYVNINKRRIGTTPAELVEIIKWDFYSSHSHAVKKEDLRRIWSCVKPRIARNAGLANFTIDYDGAKSDYFFPWLIMVGRSPATSLEMAYGSGYNLRGEWIEEVSEDDEIYPFVENDPTFVVHREKMDYIANLAVNARNAVQKGSKTKIVDLGAGRVMWAMRHRDILEPERQTILAFDKDPLIPSSMFDQEKTGIVFKNADVADELWRPGCRNANLIIMSGVASYYPLDVFKARILHPVFNLLQHGGAFFFDLQLDCPYYRRSMSIFDWPKIDLAKNCSAAIDNVERLRRTMWRQGMRFSVNYQTDTYSECATTLMVTMTKL